VSAVAAAGALAVAAAALVLGGTVDDQDEPGLPDDVVLLSSMGFDATTGQPLPDALPAADALEEARAVLPGAEEITVRGTGLESPWDIAADPALFGDEGHKVVELGTPLPPRPVGVRERVQSGPGWSDLALVADAALLDAIRADDSLRSALGDTGIVLLTGFGNGPLMVTPPGATEPVPARAVHHSYGVGYRGRLLVSEDRAEALGLETVPTGVLFHLPAPITDAQRDGLEDLRYDNGVFAPSSLDVQWAWDRDGPTPLQVELILSGIALVFSLFVVGVSLALAAAESKDERDILTIAGAPPAALARSAGARAWLLAAIGGALAVPVGFLPVVVFSYASHDQLVDERFPLVFPGRTVLMLLVAVPAIVCAVSFASSATAQRLRPVRVSTATFE
jgi:hypothetical protein